MFLDVVKCKRENVILFITAIRHIALEGVSTSVLWACEVKVVGEHARIIAPAGPFAFVKFSSLLVFILVVRGQLGDASARE